MCTIGCFFFSYLHNCYLVNLTQHALAMLYCHASVCVVLPSVCVDHIMAVFCWSVQRADRGGLPYGKPGRREKESTTH